MDLISFYFILRIITQNYYILFHPNYYNWRNTPTLMIQSVGVFLTELFNLVSNAWYVEIVSLVTHQGVSTMILRYLF